MRRIPLVLISPIPGKHAGQVRFLFFQSIFNVIPGLLQVAIELVSFRVPLRTRLEQLWALPVVEPLCWGRVKRVSLAIGVSLALLGDG